MANTSKRGFASMDNEKQRMIASKGGKAAHAKGTAHEWSSDEARAAGRKGGESRGSRTRAQAPSAVAAVASGSTFTTGTPNFLNDAGSSLRRNETENTAAPNYPSNVIRSNMAQSESRAA